jgi:uncharacterized protein YbaR (Trm112 family)
MDVCLHVSVLCCPVCHRGLALDWSTNQGVLPNVCGSRSPLRKAKVHKDLEASWKKKIDVHIVVVVIVIFYYLCIRMYIKIMLVH